MVRWAPGTEERLTKAALDLFEEHGYDQVTVTQIAERAGITRRSYFRYFPDKREVLFAGSEQLPIALAEAVLAAAPGAPLPMVLDALAEVGTQLVQQLENSATRRAVIESSEELRERERTKFAAITTAIDDALRQRAVAPATAKLVAQVATLLLGNAFDRWVDRQEDFAGCLSAATVALRELLPALGSD